MIVFTSPYPDVEIPDVALTTQVMRHAGRRPDDLAVLDGVTGTSYRYGELQEAIGRAAGGLVRAGLRKGDVVGILAPNLPLYAIVFHAVATAGGVATTINPTYTADEIAFQLRDAEAKQLVTIPAFCDVARRAVDSVEIESVLVIGEAAVGASSFLDLMTADPIDQIPVAPSEDVVALPYSSGTTGLPKGVELTHRNLVSNLIQYESVTTVDESDVVLAVLPFFHIYGMQVLMNGVLHRGAMAVTMPRFDLEQFLRIIQDHRVTRVAVVPPIVVALAKSPLVERYDLSSLVQIGSGAAPLSAEVEEEATRRTGAPIVQGFGLTETSPVTHAMPPGVVRSGSIGVPLPNTEIRLVDPESGDDLGAGEPGELWIRGPQVMKGYRSNPVATEASIDSDRWFRTGDVGYVDEDGFWFITDRLKELIKVKGFQVAPAELEAVLLSHESVVDAAVVGMPDEESGEIPVGFVVIKPGARVLADELMAHVAARVARYKQVRRLELVGTIPKSASGKILRRVLRASLDP